MRVLIGTFVLVCALAAGAVAQQTNSSNDDAKEKKTKSAETAAKNNTEKKPSQPAEKTEPSPSSEEQRVMAPKPGTDKDKEEFDVSEVPPVAAVYFSALPSSVIW